MMSVAPPGGKGTINRTGFAGYGSETLGKGKEAMKSRSRNLFIARASARRR